MKLEKLFTKLLQPETYEFSFDDMQTAEEAVRLINRTRERYYNRESGEVDLIAVDQDR